ncbi:hypothetical protein K491DRAFT_313425 [Lophiostoma macrostomum CBS 122681]|uniref:Uncharacterized protein n=1 Tax=Lophiostoma macrostomum CBS 122681 TaxID=1314788 RepID=A0A6A6SJ04_9PLEO|nr:hypothetical protein K491DRAFT_313425 [Lophiostoma macrostomum CBS 122681]
MGSFNQRRKRERNPSPPPFGRCTKVRRLNQPVRSHRPERGYVDGLKPGHTRSHSPERWGLIATDGCFYCRRVTNPIHYHYNCPEAPPRDGFDLDESSEDDDFARLRKGHESEEGLALRAAAHIPEEDGSKDGSDDVISISNDDLSDVDYDEQPLDETKITIENGPTGSRYRFRFGKYKGQSLFRRSPEDDHTREGRDDGTNWRKEEYIKWMKEEHLPLQYGKEDLANGIEYYHKRELAVFEKGHPHASMYLFESGQFKGQCIADVPDWYIHQINEEQRHNGEGGRSGIRLRIAIKWRTMLLNTNRWTWSVGKAWFAPKKKEVHRTEFAWEPKSLGPFLYPTTLPVESISSDEPYPCVCPLCSSRLQVSSTEPRDLPSDTTQQRPEEPDEFGDIDLDGFDW